MVVKPLVSASDRRSFWSCRDCPRRDICTEDPYGYPQHPADPGRTSVANIAELIGTGEAVQLLSEFNVGPTWWNGEWWHVPQGADQGARGYAMADDELASELSGRFAVLRASAQFVAKIQEERRAAAEAGRPYPETGEADTDIDAKVGSGSSSGPPRRGRWWRR